MGIVIKLIHIGVIILREKRKEGGEITSVNQAKFRRRPFHEPYYKKNLGQPKLIHHAY